MPELAIIDTPAEGPAPLAAYILAVMLYPNDTAKQLHLLEAIELQGGLISADLFLQHALEEGSHPATSRPPNENRAFHGGELAAWTLLLPLVMAARFQKTLGRRASLRALERWLITQKVSGHSHQHLHEVWVRYRSVAHLWAVYWIAGDVPVEFEPMRAFLAAAEEVRELAEAHKHKNAAETLVESGIMWRVPDGLLPPVKFGLDLTTIELPRGLIEAAAE